ncbi:MAG: hypothetical protein ACM335_00625 [Deltaproteobacteria bacterium]
MVSERIVDRLDSVFDLRIQKALNLSESVSTRVMLSYRKPEKKATFKVLSTKTTEELKRRITSWLDDHMDLEALVPRLGSEEIDMDTLAQACKG